VHQDFDGTAETLGELYYRDLRSWVKDLHGSRLLVSAAFSSLHAEYDGVFPRSKLRLYARNRRLHGPTALYWGDIISLRGQSSSGESKPEKGIHHLPGPFQPAWAFTLAKRVDQVDRLLDFDRRRLALNAASRAVLAAQNELRNATTRKFPLDVSPATVASGLDPDVRREVPTLPEELLAPELPPRLLQCLRSGWVAAFALALAEEECCELALDVASNPSAEGLRLELTERRNGTFFHEIRWIHTATGEPIPKLTDVRMRRLHFREGVRPVLSLKELKRRRIAKSLTDLGELFDGLRATCEDTQRIVSENLAEASVIHLRPRAAPLPGSSLPDQAGRAPRVQGESHGRVRRSPRVPPKRSASQ
jgi:hypothetical protein